MFSGRPPPALPTSWNTGSPGRGAAGAPQGLLRRSGSGSSSGGSGPVLHGSQISQAHAAAAATPPLELLRRQSSQTLGAAGPNEFAQQIHLPDLSADVPVDDNGFVLALEGVEGAAAAGGGRIVAGDFGGLARWEAWLAALRCLLPCSPAAQLASLWRLLAALGRSLCEPAVPEGGDLLESLMVASLPLALGVTSRVAEAQGGANNAHEGLLLAVAAALASMSERLPQVGTPQLPALQSCFVYGFAASVRCLGMLPQEAAAASKVAEAWFHAGIASKRIGELGKECFTVLSQAEASGVMPLLNLSWRWLKSLCVAAAAACADPGVDSAGATPSDAEGAEVVATALMRAASAASQQFLTILGASPLPPQGVDGALKLAAFHCSNFLRVARDASLVARRAASFPAKQLAASLVPVADALARSQPSHQNAAALARVRELFDKVSSMMLELGATPLGPGIANQHEGPSQSCLAAEGSLTPFLEQVPAARAFAANLLLLLASGRVPAAGAGNSASSILGLALTAVERCVCKGCLLGGVELDSLGILFAVGAPGVRARVIAWTVAHEPRLYCVALRLHQVLPRWLGGARAAAWADQLLDGLLGVGTGAPSRSQCQVASCITVLWAHCPQHVASESLRSSLGPMLRPGCGGALPPAAWLLVRRVAASASSAVAAGNGAASAAAGAAKGIASCISSDLRSGQVVAAPQLRALAALLRAGLLPDAELAALGRGLRQLLSNAEVPLPLRVEAWASHAEVCMRTKASDDFRVSLLYARKHLSPLPGANVRVLAALARAPAPLLSGGGPLPSSILEEGAGSEAPWPLRVAALAAASALIVRPGAPDALRAAAQAILKTFEQEAPRDADPASQARARASKRRRLLQELAQLPLDVGATEVAAQQELVNLCLASRARIEGWLRDCGWAPAEARNQPPAGQLSPQPR